MAVEYRWAENQYDRLPALAADLVRRRVAAIVAHTTPTALAAQAATQTTSVVLPRLRLSAPASSVAGSFIGVVVEARLVPAQRTAARPAS